MLVSLAVNIGINLPLRLYLMSIDTCALRPPFFYYLHTYVEPQFDENGNLAPEQRLPAAFVGAFAIPICLFWFGWSARPSVHWYAIFAFLTPSPQHSLYLPASSQ